MKMKGIITMIVVALVAVGIGFYGGVQYQKSQRSSVSGGMPGAPGGGTGQPGGTGKTGGSATTNRPVSGEITSMDSNSVTIKTQDGSSKIVLFSNSTKINKTSEGSSSDLKTGEQVTAIGPESSDGTVTAQTISVGGNMPQGMPSGQPT